MGEEVFERDEIRDVLPAHLLSAEEREKMLLDNERFHKLYPETLEDGPFVLSDETVRSTLTRRQQSEFHADLSRKTLTALRFLLYFGLGAFGMIVYIKDECVSSEPRNGIPVSELVFGVGLSHFLVVSMIIYTITVRSECGNVRSIPRLFEIIEMIRNTVIITAILVTIVPREIVPCGESLSYGVLIFYLVFSSIALFIRVIYNMMTDQRLVGTS
jgi:hypothetical protein